MSNAILGKMTLSGTKVNMGIDLSFANIDWFTWTELQSEIRAQVVVALRGR
jgi:hypothetical protein